jgi:hypothetical protein
MKFSFILIFTALIQILVLSIQTIHIKYTNVLDPSNDLDLALNTSDKVIDVIMKNKQYLYVLLSQINNPSQCIIRKYYISLPYLLPDPTFVPINSNSIAF